MNGLIILVPDIGHELVIKNFGKDWIQCEERHGEQKLGKRKYWFQGIKGVHKHKVIHEGGYFPIVGKT